MTYRERRLAKAERLREWAEKREAKSAASFKRAHDIADMIPLGQPILVGHHSQRHAERDAERIDNGMRAGFEHGDKARRMHGKAGEIERQADRAIYSDDPDAVEALTARIAELEVERETKKARNAAYRTEHKAELKALTAYWRDQAMPHPSFELTNLSGNIARNKKRLAELSSPRQFNGLWLKYGGECDSCQTALERGDWAAYNRETQALRCGTCYQKNPA